MATQNSLRAVCHPHEQGWVTHSQWWHDLRQPHSAKHTPSPAAASKASTHGQQNSSTTSAGGALYIGAFVGMPRSAAYKGVVARVKANSAADPTASMRRSMAHPPLLIIYSIPSLTPREADRQQFTAQLESLWHLGNKLSQNSLNGDSLNEAAQRPRSRVLA